MMIWAIMINYPTTGRPVSTGILTDEDSFSRLSHLPGAMHCPDCGQHHDWAISYAWLGPAFGEGNAIDQEKAATPVDNRPKPPLHLRRAPEIRPTLHPQSRKEHSAR